ncbi:MAG: hypothetical protein ABIJ36_02765 [Patescibacteria group bacterium]
MGKIFSVKVQEISSPENSAGDYVSLPYTFDPEDKLMEEQRGKLFAALDISGDGILKEDLNAGARLVFNILRETYFGELESTPLQALEKAIHIAKEKVSNMPLNSEDAVPRSLDLNLIAAVLWGKVLYVAQFGAGVACIIKEDMAVNIGKDVEGEVVVSSGIVEKGDVLVLGSGGFKELFSLEELPASFSKLTDENFLKDNKKISAVIVKFDVLNFWGGDNVIKFAKDSAKPARGFRIKVPSASFEARSKKKLAILGAIAVLLVSALAFSIKISFNKSPKGETMEGANAGVVKELNDKLLSAKSLIGTDDNKAKEILTEIAKAGFEDLSPQDKEEVTKVLGTATDLLDEIEGVAPLEKGNLVYDFSVDGVDNPSGLAYADTVLYVWYEDTTFGVGLEIGGETPVSSKADFGEKPLFVDLYDGNVYVLNGSGMSLATDNGQFIKQDVEGEVFYDKALAFKIYYGNGYVLTSETITKISVLDEGYSAGVWLKVPLSLEKAVDFALDGNVYVLFSEGNVKKLYIGEEDSAFLLKDMPSPLKEPRFIYTTIDMNDIYIFNAGDGSIVVVDKVGEFQKKYRIKDTSINFSDVKGFAVNTAGDKAFILVGSKIIEFSL